jgi:hypothetical protein
MLVNQKILDDVTKEIIRNNRNIGVQAVPHSDQLVKFIQSSMGIPVESAKLAVRFLIESHRILSIEIVAEDKDRGIDKTEGYISADLSVIGPVKVFFQDLLCQMYEKQFKKHVMIHQLIKEIFPIIKTFNNTELGQVINKTIMLMEYERMIEKNYSSYSIEFQEKALLEISHREHFDYTPKIPVTIKGESSFTSSPSAASSHETVNNSFNRAVDSPVYREFSEKKDHYPIQRILNIYGIDFFLKANFRKYQFGQIKNLIDDRQITKRADLMAVRAMLETVKSRIYSDKELELRREEIYALERSVSHAMYFTQTPPKKK